ncbi:uncharacterized protein misp3 isoform X2 [Antennarius striatus]|uniref:uncharacterized protein misp3 isoform X2 n=1 Tax=Antennarius striatus TaxID=241820 RepID=UPI0035AFB979
MGSAPVTWQEQASVISPNQCVYGIRLQGEVGAIRCRSSPLQDKKAPRAEPEEDIDILEPGAQDKTKQSINTCEDAILNPVSPSVLSTEECFETEGFSSLEVEWISEGDIISNPMQDQNFQKWPEACLLTDLLDYGGDLTPEEMTAADMRKEENFTQLSFSPGDYHSEPENDISWAASEISSTYYSPSERNNSDNEPAVCSPPFADESEEEEGASTDLSSRLHRFSKLYSRDKQSYCMTTSISNKPTSTLPAVPSAKQQNELSTHSQREHTPKGPNQEATQQVLGQGSPPLSSVAMELSSKGGAASQGYVCVVLSERHSRAGEKTQKESKQASGENDLKEVGLQRNKVLEQKHGEGLLKDSKLVQRQDFKREKNSFALLKNSRMECDSCDDSQSDSGVSADFSPCNTMEDISSETPSAAQKETPIEREIRRAVEREQSLRRSRGLPNLSTLPEYVDIPLRKSVPCLSLTAKSERCQGKDRQFAGKKMQLEIQGELQREQDLVRLGKVPGFYDKGTVRQLKERKQLFEAFQTPSHSNMTVSTTSKVTSEDMSSSECQEYTSSQTSTKGSYSPNSEKEGGYISLIARGPGYREATCCEVLILENDLSVPAQKLYLGKPESKPIPAVDSGSPTVSLSTTGHRRIKGKEQKQVDEEAREASKDNPFFKLRSSVNVIRVEQDIQVAKEREEELLQQRISLYGNKGGAKECELPVERPASIEVKSPVLTSSLNGPDVLDSSIKAETGPLADQSVGRVGRWPPVQDGEEINQPEVRRSPRAPRQKTPLVEQWESGLVKGHNEEGN